MPPIDSFALSRRDFLELSSLAAAAALPKGERERIESLEVPTEQQAFALEEVTIAQLQDDMKSGKRTSKSITQAYLGRIAAMDQKGPTLRALLETNPDALTIAEQLDAERKQGKLRGGLHGVPVIIKDNLDTHDRMQTTAGSLGLEGNIAEQDSTVARRLREAGAVILGKSNLSEWANFRSSRSSSGWSGRGRQCKNPFVLDRNPSGSSSGTGSSVSANFAAAGIGTETNGSIISPSNACGLVGIKPTVGLVSRGGIIPIARSQDTAGPMCRNVSDAAIMLTAIAGSDPRDSATAEADARKADYTKSLDPDGLRGARIGVVYRRAGDNPIVDKLVDDAIKVLRDKGAEVVDPVDIESQGQLGNNERDVLRYEFKNHLNAYLATMPANVKNRTLADLIAFNDANKNREMPYFGQETFIASQACGPLTDPAYIDARAKCLELTRAKGIDGTMDKNRLDAILGPSGGPAGLVDLATLRRGGGGAESSEYPAISGYPHITVPGGFHMGLPVGISFYGRAWSEATLIKFAFAFEQATKARQAPKFIPTLALY